MIHRDIKPENLLVGAGVIVASSSQLSSIGAKPQTFLNLLMFRTVRVNSRLLILVGQYTHSTVGGLCVGL